MNTNIQADSKLFYLRFLIDARNDKSPTLECRWVRKLCSLLFFTFSPADALLPRALSRFPLEDRTVARLTYHKKIRHHSQSVEKVYHLSFKTVKHILVKRRTSNFNVSTST